MSPLGKKSLTLLTAATTGLSLVAGCGGGKLVRVQADAKKLGEQAAPPQAN